MRSENGAFPLRGWWLGRWRCCWPRCGRIGRRSSKWSLSGGISPTILTDSSSFRWRRSFSGHDADNCRRFDCGQAGWEPVCYWSQRGFAARQAIISWDRSTDGRFRSGLRGSSGWCLDGNVCVGACRRSCFLWFMVPIPFSAETMLSVPLQRVATKLSTECLVMLGQPALSEGNTIWLGDNHLMIEEACSGLRILVGIYALAFAFVLFSTWAWWQKALALVAALPIAIVANVIRIVVTGLLYQFSTSNAARHFMHDFSGLLMIPLAAAMFWLLLVYLDHLFPEVEEISSLEAGGSHL